MHRRESGKCGEDFEGIAQGDWATVVDWECEDRMA
jgi:hypothetical protein